MSIDYDKLYYQKNKDHIKKYKKEYYYKNRDKRIKQRKEYYFNHIEQEKERIKKYKQKNKEKIKAHSIINNAIKMHKINKPINCSMCNKYDKIDAHHEDYKKPLDVIWVCKSCHRIIHNKIYRTPERRKL